MYKVFINETPLFFTNTEGVLPEWKSDDNSLIVKYLGKKKFLHNYIDLLEKSNKYTKIVIYDDKVDDLWHDFTDIYRIVEAAGGVVFNQNKEVLVIYRLQHWDLPKGKIEKGETPELAAIREVQEETGLVNVRLRKHLKDTYHTYEMKGKRILKKTYWYEMNTTDLALLPQLEEDIEKAEWVDLNKFLDTNLTIYGNILDVLKCV